MEAERRPLFHERDEPNQTMTSDEVDSFLANRMLRRTFGGSEMKVLTFFGIAFISISFFGIGVFGIEVFGIGFMS